MKSNANVTPAFQQVFFTVVCLTLLSGAISLNLASQANLSREQTRIFETCNTTWNMGIGVIFGLLGSKAADLFQSSDDQESKEN
ncbi:MAG: hypothetical protein AAFX80_20940, partial [Cyanobacteria bacterium J06639_18]